jgi:tetratricopeptide (TPR) repeat protein
MASLATQLPYGPGLLGAGGGGVSGLEERLIGPANGAGPGRLLGAIERLEKRVFELEHTTQMPAQEIGGAGDGGDWDRGAGAAAEASLQLGRSQAMMNLGQYEEALTCLNQFLEHRPEHAEGLIKKGSILEKLNRAEEAIACYDQAIALNGSLTLAYLYKGGLFNRLERFDEALACYEQALKTQGKPVS